MIKLATRVGAGTQKGKKVVAAYWQKALDRIPDLRFELIDVSEGVDSIAVYYHSVMGKRSVEVMYCDASGKVERVVAS